MNEGSHGGLRGLALDWRVCAGVCVLAAAAFRAAVWSEFSSGPLEMYSKISTLDMKFLLSQAQSLLHLQGSLTMHRLLCALSAAFTGGEATTRGVVAAQMLLGVATALFVCLAALRVSGSRVAALSAGLSAGCYAPAMMYECFVMKESVTLFFSALTLWSFVAAGGGLWRYALHGLAAAALPLARPAGLLWGLGSTLLLSLRGRRKGAAFVAAPLALFVATLGGAFAFNWAAAKSPRIFDTNVGYNFQVGAIPEARSYNVDGSGVESLSKAALMARVAWNAPGKALSLLRAYQPPDNVNYYFMKEALPALEFAPGPLLLVPLGVSGLLLGLWLALRKGRPRYAVPLAHFVLMALPICAFVASGRYMLFLLPSLAVAGGCFVHFAVDAARRSARSGRYAAPALLAAVWLLAFWQAIPSEPLLRADDFIGYGLALNMKKGLCQEEGECYARALEVNPSSASAAVNLSKWLIDMRRPADAVELLAPFRAVEPGHFGILVNYSLSLLMTGRRADAERELLFYGEPEGAAKAKWRTLLDLARGEGKGVEGK